MDPASVTSLVATCLSILATTAKAIRGLHDLKSKLDDTVADVGVFLAQISSIQSSVKILHDWLDSDSAPQSLQSNNYLRETIDLALDNPLFVISSIEKHFENINFLTGNYPLVVD
ncbi:hypothetical protein QBC38DRAFT_445356 [Podospora fimiseda]|uniref:Fungal N-terminal domain-containing protein n=1 Tax=Podospora fimiseda TaxID=252190 RepID=A0AAN7BLQ7_9PEZI|nr:hypothetical protein QBC38DRAFT_445356 [Podospora fimiseda]